MATLDAQSERPATAVVFTPKPDRAPPISTVGVLGWLRENLFYSWFSTLLTLGGLYLLYSIFAALYSWGVTYAIWDAETYRQCTDIDVERGVHGACWAGVLAWFNGFIYGRYPDAEQWRVNLGFLTLVAWLAPLWFPQLKDKIAIGITAVLLYPFLALYLFHGGERGWFMQLMVFLAIAMFAYNWLHIAVFFATKRSLKEWLVGLTGFAHKHEGTHKYPVAAFIAVLYGILFLWLGDWTLREVGTNLWGGLFLTLVIAGVAITSALPGGVILALARRSHMPIIRVFAVAFIELFRSVPLITVLFMAVTMMPLFLPEGFQLNKLVQAIIGVCLFASAYMAEVVRGGLQAIPNGQYEAAKSMGLNYWQSMNLIILPQALKLMIPNIVGNFIGLLKDTTLVSIIGLYDMLLMIKASGTNPTWNGLHTEPLVFGAAVYFILCYAMSQYSQRLERKLGTGHER